MPKDIKLKTVFNDVASLYDEVRPTYPAELFTELIYQTDLHSGSKVLEIGSGTGQATKPLAEIGCAIIGVELGDKLAKLARENLKIYPNVTIINRCFEAVELGNLSFDLVYSATAFHWVDPEVKFKKSHYLLKDSGHLAIINTKHVSDEIGDEFFFAVQPIYAKYRPGNKHDENFRLPKKSEVKPEIVDKNLFKIIHFKTFPVVINYSAKRYAQLLNTYSNTLEMEVNTRHKFLQAIETLINDEFSGNIDKHFAMSLTIASKI